ncbi:MAG: Ada metal-binding domain-containing protein [Cyanobacteria bacterium J06573_11]
MQKLDPHVCYQAMQANDPRFDGRFLVGVASTGIFCRPVCSARLPKYENCTFYLSAGAAQQAGYRPCLRCRPELAPAVNVNGLAGGTVVNRALQLIEAGALDEDSVAALAARLGVSDRTLRQQFSRYVGTSPGQVAKTRRLLFAKRLIDETRLPMTEVAISAGFKSIRSFNSAFQKTYGRSPSEFRRKTVSPIEEQTEAQKETPFITLKLPFSRPYNWQALMAFWQPRSILGVEVATADQYCRSIVIDGQPGWVSVRPVAQQPYLQVQIGQVSVGRLSRVMARLRQMFDVGVNVAAVEAHLARSHVLAPLFSKARPSAPQSDTPASNSLLAQSKAQSNRGLRIPGAWDPFELSVRAIVGQQVSVAAATTVFNRIVATYGEPLAAPGKPAALEKVFPPPQVLSDADLTLLGLVRAKAKAISHLAQVVSTQPDFFNQMTTLDSAVKTLCELPGIGPWTAHYIAMRALNEPDALPPGDLALHRAAKRLGHAVTKKEFEQMAEAWRPWRGYGAMYLWQFDAQMQASQVAMRC